MSSYQNNDAQATADGHPVGCASVGIPSDRAHHKRRSKKSFARPLALAQSLGRSISFVLLMGVSVPFARAESSPPVKIVVPYAAGGVTDQAARILGGKMSQILGGPVIIENRPGGGSRLGMQTVAQAPADGSILLFTNVSYSTLALIDRTIRFDPLTSFSPIGLAATYGAAVVVKPSLGIKTLQELTAYAKRNPGKLNYGSAGPGSGAHLVGEYYKTLTGVSIVHIPYRSTSAALTDVVGGQVDVAFDATAKPMIDAGRVKALAIVGSHRDPRMPDVPTAAEAGVEGLDFDSWLGLFAPVGTPQNVIDKLNAAMNTALQDASIRRNFEDVGLLVKGGAPDRLTQQLRSDAIRYRQIIEKSKLKFDQE